MGGISKKSKVIGSITWRRLSNLRDTWSEICELPRSKASLGGSRCQELRLLNKRVLGSEASWSATWSGRISHSYKEVQGRPEHFKVLEKQWNTQVVLVWRGFYPFAWRWKIIGKLWKTHGKVHWRQSSCISPFACQDPSDQPSVEPGKPRTRYDEVGQNHSKPIVVMFFFQLNMFETMEKNIIEITNKIK